MFEYRKVELRTLAVPVQKIHALAKKLYLGTSIAPPNNIADTTPVLLYVTAHPTLDLFLNWPAVRTELYNMYYHQIELEQGFPKPVAKVSEVFGRGFYGPWTIGFCGKFLW